MLRRSIFYRSTAAMANDYAPQRFLKPIHLKGTGSRSPDQNPVYPQETTDPRTGKRYVEGKLDGMELIEPQSRVDDFLVGPRNARDASSGEVSNRTVEAQPHYFRYPIQKKHNFEWEKRHEDWYYTETNIIWKAFDTPEKLTVFMRDEVLRGNKKIMSAEWLEKMIHWVKETRYWRCIGISKPFYDKDRLRAYAWASEGTDVGNVQMSAVMWDAVMDLELALKRKEAGLAPNYIWDNWGPGGHLDGQRMDFLPRFELNPHIDPDGISVSKEDVATFTTHEQLKDRYSEFIDVDSSIFRGTFFTPSNGALTLADFDPEVQRNTLRLKNDPDTPLGRQVHRACQDTSSKEFKSFVDNTALTPDEVRSLIYVSADDRLLAAFGASVSKVSNQQTDAGYSFLDWDDVMTRIQPLREKYDPQLDCLRAFHYLTRSVDECRDFYLEKCGFRDWMVTSDKDLTAATLGLLEDMLELVKNHEWARRASIATTDIEKRDAVDEEAFVVWKVLQNLERDHKRRRWIARFTGEPHTQKALDDMLDKIGKRMEPEGATNVSGFEFDREVEPVGRKVQRQVLESDKASAPGGTAHQRDQEDDGVKKKKKKGMFHKGHRVEAGSLFDKLHEKQVMAKSFNDVRAAGGAF